MEEKDVGGYSVAYGPEEIRFPVFVVATLSAACLAGAFFTGQTIWAALAIVGGGYTYYNAPLLETGRPVMGANQYGIFIQAFGLVRWRAVSRIDLASIAERDTTIHELQIALQVPLASALVADWRKRPWFRSLMRMPWTMTWDNVVRVKLGPFDQPPDEIHRTLLRMWRYYRS